MLIDARLMKDALQSTAVLVRYFAHACPFVVAAIKNRCLWSTSIFVPAQLLHPERSVLAALLECLKWFSQARCGADRVRRELACLVVHVRHEADVSLVIRCSKSQLILRKAFTPHGIICATFENGYFRRNPVATEAERSDLFVFRSIAPSRDARFLTERRHQRKYWYRKLRRLRCFTSLGTRSIRFVRVFATRH